MSWAFWGSDKSSEAVAQDARDDSGEDPGAALRVRTRRRLIGAAALLLATVIVVPLLLDSEPRPIPESVVIDIPNEKTPFTPQLAPQPAPAAADKPSAVGGDQPVAPAASIPAAAAESAADSSASTQPATRVAAPAKVPATPEAAARVKPSTATAPAAKPAAAPEPGKFILQVAAVAQEEKARELVSKLKAAGLPAYTEKVTEKVMGKAAAGAGSQARVRVRVGPFAARAAAEKAEKKLAGLGFKARWVDR